MGRKAQDNKSTKNGRKEELMARLHPDTKQSIWGITFAGTALILLLAWIGKAGPVGEAVFSFFERLFGIGYFILPLTLLFMAGALLMSSRRRIVGLTMLSSVLLIFSSLGLIHIVKENSGGWLGAVFGYFKVPFGTIGALIINAVIFIISLLMISNTPIRLKFRVRQTPYVDPAVTGVSNESDAADPEDEEEEDEEEAEEEDGQEPVISHMKELSTRKAAPVFADYVPPPLELLKSSVEKPTTGDLRANANIIKRTLESFGIAAEMGEINIGPKVTRYTLKPAEGTKLSKITALNQDFAYALAAHPIRIEAPIPGKSLVGIEVPNRQAAMVRLGSLIGYPEFQNSGALSIVMGRDVNGEPIFADIEKMPHLLVAGTTGSGKSIFIHSLLTSLLYKNSPANLRFIMIDPKRVELSAYDGLPHMILPVIVESKKAIGVFRWAVKEMERRYELLSAEGRRDIKSYNAKHAAEPLHYIAIVVDELADMMQSYGREVEGLIIRLAQMARATGIHLILSTQRPSVEVITGLIKANITNRVAMQVASQIDSRTILDTSGAEKLLGGGDLLFISQEISKPKRIQGAFISEEEINKVCDFIREKNKPIGGSAEVLNLENGGSKSILGDEQSMLEGDFEDGDDDEMYSEAVMVVSQAKKASASLLQRRLKVGYARAARLLDLMEANGLIGPGEGAKPREVFIEQFPENSQ